MYVRASTALFTAFLGCSCVPDPIGYERICELRLKFLPDQVMLSDSQRRQLRDLASTASVGRFKLTVVRNGISPVTGGLTTQIGREIINSGVLNEDVVVENYFDGSASAEMLFFTCKEGV